jgi:dnd system-associated protein 4
MTRRILKDVRRSMEFEDMYDRLGNREFKWVDGRPDGAPLFGTLRELLCFAAVLGFQFSRREKLDGHATAPVPEEVFAKHDDALSCVRMLALAETKDYMVFAEERVDEMVTIFEEYALGGSRLINQFLSEYPSDILGADALLEGLRKEKLLPPRSANTGAGLGAVSFATS